MDFLDISRYHYGRIGLVPVFCGNVLYDVPPTHVDKFILFHSGYLIASLVSISGVILTPHFPNFADFRQLQISYAQTKYYEILTATMPIPRNTTRKIASWYIEFEYHLSTLQKHFRLLLKKGVYEWHVGHVGCYMSIESVVVVVGWWGWCGGYHANVATGNDVEMCWVSWWHLGWVVGGGWGFRGRGDLCIPHPHPLNVVG